MRRVMFIFLIIISQCGYAAWIPAFTAYNPTIIRDYATGYYFATEYRVTGLNSAVGYSSDKMQCNYMKNLESGTPLSSSQKTEKCTIHPEVKVDFKPNPVYFRWRFEPELEISQNELYNANVRTVGEYFAYAQKIGLLNTIHKIIHAESSPVGVFIEFIKGSCIHFEQGGGTTDNACHQLTIPDNTCQFDQKIELDHGTIRTVDLINGISQASVRLNYSCPKETTVNIYLNDTRSALPLVAKQGQGSVKAKLSLDGVSLHNPAGLKTKLKSGSHALTLRSVVSGTGEGEFQGSGVLIISVY